MAKSRSGSGLVQGSNNWFSDALTPEHLKETAPDYDEIEVALPVPVEADPLPEDKLERKPAIAKHVSAQERYNLIMEEANG